MAEQPSPGRWRWLLGGRDSWRRIIFSGAATGVMLAGVAALVVALMDDSGAGSLDRKEPTAMAPVQGGVDEPVEEPPVEQPTAIEEPTEAPLPTEPVEEPTEPPEPTLEEPTAIPTDTPVIEESTPVETVPNPPPAG